MTLPSPAIPETMRALVLDGTGFDHLAVRRVPVPRPGPRQLLARVDAAGICTSLIKLVEQGPDHNYLYGWDTAAHPLILGDEGSITLVEVGEELRGQYAPGGRYVVQPAVDHGPINHRERYRNGGRGIGKVAVGYTLPGHLAEYQLITEETLAAGCLLPLPDASMPFAHATLAEPFCCVICGQDHHLHLDQPDPLGPRRPVKGLLPGGATLIFGAGAMGRMHVDLAFSWRPRVIIVADVVDSRLERVRQLFGERARTEGIALAPVNSATAALPAIVDELTDARGADDVIVAVGSAAAMKEAQALAGRGAVINLFGGLKKDDSLVPFDTGAIHYRELVVTGSSGGSPYDIAATLDLISRKQIDPGAHIAMVGDLEHAPRFLDFIRERKIDGKAIVYPHRPMTEILTVERWSAEDEAAHLGAAR